MEVWKDIIGFEGRYQVSNLGRVQSVAGKRISKNGRVFHQKGAIRKIQYGHKSGYPLITLTVDDINFTKCVHALVASAFLEKPKMGVYEVCHRDNDKTNNSAANLYWGTKKENASDRAKHGTLQRGEDHPNAKLSWDDAEFIRANRGIITRRVLASMFGISASRVGRVLANESYVRI